MPVPCPHQSTGDGMPPPSSPLCTPIHHGLSNRSKRNKRPTSKIQALQHEQAARLARSQQVKDRAANAARADALQRDLNEQDDGLCSYQGGKENHAVMGALMPPTPMSAAKRVNTTDHAISNSLHRRHSVIPPPPQFHRHTAPVDWNVEDQEEPELADGGYDYEDEAEAAYDADRERSLGRIGNAEVHETADDADEEEGVGAPDNEEEDNDKEDQDEPDEAGEDEGLMNDGEFDTVEDRPHKRHASNNCDLLTTRITKQARKSRKQKNRIRVAARDFDDLTQRVIAHAQTLYRCHISTSWPYPTKSEELKEAAKCWKEACEGKNVMLEFDNDHRKLITNRASHVRGELKTKARPHVRLAYKLQNPPASTTNRNGIIARKNAISRMRVKVEALLDQDTYLFKDTDNRTGYFLNTVLQNIINDVWFMNRDDEGIELKKMFDPISNVTIALVATVVGNILDEYATGEFVKILFASTAYTKKFQTHYAALMEYQDKYPDASLAWRRKLTRKARAHAGLVEEDREAQVSHMSSVDLGEKLAELAAVDFSVDTDSDPDATQEDDGYE